MHFHLAYSDCVRQSIYFEYTTFYIDVLSNLISGLLTLYCKIQVECIFSLARVNYIRNNDTTIFIANEWTVVIHILRIINDFKPWDFKKDFLTHIVSGIIIVIYFSFI